MLFDECIETLYICWVFKEGSVDSPGLCSRDVFWKYQVDGDQVVVGEHHGFYCSLLKEENVILRYEEVVNLRVLYVDFYLGV